MWKLVLNEIKYNWGFALVLLMLSLSYTYFCINNIQLLEGAEYEVDYWGGIFAFFLYFMCYAFWVQRIKEQRIRKQILLPVSQKTVSLSRIFIIQGSTILLALYFVVVHFLMIDRWYEETGSILLQVGMFNISFFLFLIIRDRWYSSTSISLKITNAAVAVLILIAILYWFFISGRLLFYQYLGKDFGRLSLIMIALFIAPIIHITFNKRRFYLT